jgi:hypothetical protein
MTSKAVPLVLPRGLIFLASIWLIGSWLIAIGVRPPVQPSSASYTPGVQLMLLCMAIGLMIGWPLLRLSQPALRAPIRQTLLDLAVLLSLVQVVIWPLRLVTAWSTFRIAAIDTTLCGWTLLAGATVAAAIGSDRQGPRTLAMSACVGMCLLGPALAWLGVLTGVNALELINLGPLMAIRTLGDGGGAQPELAQWRWIALLNAAAIVAWLTMAVWMLWRWRREPRLNDQDEQQASGI